MTRAALLLTCATACSGPELDDTGDEVEQEVVNCTIAGLPPTSETTEEGDLVRGRIDWSCDGGSYPTQLWEVGLDDAPAGTTQWNYIPESFSTSALSQGGADIAVGLRTLTTPGACYRTQATDTPEHRFHVVSADSLCF